MTEELTDLTPEPSEVWHEMLRFVGWGSNEQAAAARSVEPLFRHGPDLVVQVYNYLLSVPETAAVLGWEQQQSAHLSERRRFFLIWLSRTLGLDSSDQFGWYLFRAGASHAGHGARRIHTPARYVTGAYGLVLASFAQILKDEGLTATDIADAMAAWSKYFAAQQNQMLLGYEVARDLSDGPLAVRCMFYGRLRTLVGRSEQKVCIGDGESVGVVLRKLLNYHPQIRGEALERVWHSEEHRDSSWVAVVPAYVPRRGWRFLLNGRDVLYNGGFGLPLHDGDELALFPPGR